MLQKLDRKERIRFTDIALPSFDASAVGVPLEQLMARIHGRDLRAPDGGLLEGVEVFRRLYAAVGLGPLVRLTRAPGVRQVLDRGYDWFAKNRLWLTGREREAEACVDGRCAIPERGVAKTATS